MVGCVLCKHEISVRFRLAPQIARVAQRQSVGLKILRSVVRCRPRALHMYISQLVWRNWYTRRSQTPVLSVGGSSPSTSIRRSLFKVDAPEPISNSNVIVTLTTYLFGRQGKRLLRAPAWRNWYTRWF